MLDAKQRLKATGVTGRKLAQRLGVRDATVSDALRGRTAAPYVHAAIEALEIMTPDQRAAWLGEPGR
jgi:transcriptional regulator with XRE-family HTH domain